MVPALREVGVNRPAGRVSDRNITLLATFSVDADKGPTGYLRNGEPSHHFSGDKVGLFNIAWQANAHPAGHELDQR